MSTFKVHKVVAALPDPLAANAVYAVRVGEGFDLYITDSTGSIAHKINPTATWTDYAARWDTSPSLVGLATTPIAGRVFSYLLGGITRYRLVPTAYNPAADAFYSGFANGACTGLICTRG